MGTVQPQNNGTLYSNTVIGRLAVDGWAVPRPAESQRGPRGRPLSGPLHIPSLPSFPPALPTLSPATKRPPQKRRYGGFSPGKFIEN